VTPELELAVLEAAGAELVEELATGAGAAVVAAAVVAATAGAVVLARPLVA
jgi:hypothetical protein